MTLSSCVVTPVDDICADEVHNCSRGCERETESETEYETERETERDRGREQHNCLHWRYEESDADVGKNRPQLCEVRVVVVGGTDVVVSYLYLDSNQLNGTIPSGISALTRLKYVHRMKPRGVLTTPVALARRRVLSLLIGN